MDIEINKPKFCSECGLSLVKLDTWCSSRNCDSCGKKVFYIRPGQDGGIKVEKGEQIHIPELTFSLDPKTGGQFSRYGLEGFIKQLFIGRRIQNKEEFIEVFKETESSLDLELKNLDCISHCDLETKNGVSEAIKILNSEGLHEYELNLIKSGVLRECYEAIESGDTLRAAYTAHQSCLFGNLSMLENNHLKKIIWLGYQCYVDLCKNEEMSDRSAREQRLIKKVLSKIKALETELLYIYVNDGSDIAPRMSLSGIEESTLKALLGHELESREIDRDEALKNEEIEIKKMSNRIKVWGFLFTLANGLILALYKQWIG